MINDKFILTVSIALLVAYLGYKIFNNRKYVFKTKIKSIMFYPIKSLPGIEVDHLEITLDYMKYKNFKDRSYALINDDNRTIELKTEPKLAKIKIRLLENDIQLDAPDMVTIKIPNNVPLKKGDLIHTINLWGDEIDGQECSKKINDWFTKYLGKSTKLIRHQKQFKYRKSTVIVNNKLEKVDYANTIYHGAAPVSLMNLKSIEDLNERIMNDYKDENPSMIESNRFRMNLNFKTDIPYEEDDWKYVKINNTVLKFAQEAGRCKITCLNLETLKYEQEPLRSLKKYRMGPYHLFEGSPKLGCYYTVLKGGIINVGDDIFVSY